MRDTFLKFGIDHSKEESILIKQNTTTIVTRSSRDLLRTMEDAAGTTVIGLQSYSLGQEVITLGSNISNTKQRINEIENTRNQMLPLVEDACRLRLRNYQNVLGWIHYYEKKILKLIQDLHLAEEYSLVQKRDLDTSSELHTETLIQKKSIEISMKGYEENLSTQKKYLHILSKEQIKMKEKCNKLKAGLREVNRKQKLGQKQWLEYNEKVN